MSENLSDKEKEKREVLNLELMMFLASINEVMTNVNSCSFKFEPHLLGPEEVSSELDFLKGFLGGHGYSTELRAHLPDLAKIDNTYRSEQPIKYELIIRR
jgi:hypothetical protein